MHPFDGNWIAMRLAGLEFFRPVPHNLIARLLDVGRMRVEKVAVTALREDTFYGSLWLRAGGVLHEIDVRPSDAIAIALDRGAPIFVAEETLRTPGCTVLAAGHELEGLEADHQRAIAEGKTAPETIEKEWRSFRSLPRREGKWLRPRPADGGRSPDRRAGDRRGAAARRRVGAAGERRVPGLPAAEDDDVPRTRAQGPSGVRHAPAVPRRAPARRGGPERGRVALVVEVLAALAAERGHARLDE